MEVDYFAMPLHPPGANPTQTLDDDLAQIVCLDQLGYKEAWIVGSPDEVARKLRHLYHEVSGFGVLLAIKTSGGLPASAGRGIGVNLERLDALRRLLGLSQV